MNFSRLRILGFKTFVEPTDVPIEPGLTGVVGPNGCGKSNLVEALRWVMGESSYKAMRASGMDDVIFSGSGNRPARNMAEVTLTIDNADRTAPIAFNDSDSIEISRRIERESGSAYRINGREVRARDVQILFADASTGAHSPAMVGQGRIGELIAAKPQARRALLEEAAGISGLAGRRHDAELRLKAAEQNLERIEDVLREIDTQLDSLKRQARQAVRYRTLSGEIRKAEALGLALRLRIATAAVGEAEAALAAAAELVTARAAEQGRAARDQAVAAAGLPALREAANNAAAALQRLRLEHEQIDAEDRRVRDQLADLERRIAQFDSDAERERQLAGENTAMLARLDEEQQRLTAEEAGAAQLRDEAAARLAAAEAALAASEAAAAEATGALADLTARRKELQRSLAEAGDRAARQAAELERVEREAAALTAAADSDGRLGAARADAEAATAALTGGEAAMLAAEKRIAATREAEAQARAALDAAERHLGRIDTEMRTLTQLLQRSDARDPVLDRITVASGYEAALAAAFGEELELSDDPAAPAHWRTLAGDGADPVLPPGAEPLADRTAAPPALARRLAQTGIVARQAGAELQKQLRPGQSIVSREGDLWRWDGYTAAAEAKTAAAERLAGRNRLAELTGEVTLARQSVEEKRARHVAADAEMRAAAAAETAARDAWRGAQKALDAARGRVAEAERAGAQATARLAALTEAQSRLTAAKAEAEAARAEAEAALARLANPGALEAPLADMRRRVEAGRAAVAESRSEARGLEREAELRRSRLAAIADERQRWQQRMANAATHVAALAERRSSAEAERTRLAERPGELIRTRAQLAHAIEAAAGAQKEAADALAAAETAQAGADREAQGALVALSEAREQRGRAEERLEAAKQRSAEVAARITEVLDCAPPEAATIAGLAADAPSPALDQVDARLDRLKQERERLGGVNLRAEQEAEELETRRTTLTADRDDLVAAIQKLRQGISSLNREGRERLQAAFAAVNERFQQLFTSLFGGGTAELQFTDSDDPLQAGLDILARPPGKKPQTMTLLSGGEQALTALALIFAVFLTNPAPICVLDEVDAPLDDANVERFCLLLEEMSRQTSTRFLVITHNPITMARMSRLYGVTMVERGVSQLVSVDLETAERFREAG